MFDRATWRRLVQRSTLPNGVKLTLLAHAQSTSRHHHDDQENRHSVTQDRLARAVGKDQRTVQRHIRTAQHAGYLSCHSPGHNGAQAVYHYALPGHSIGCDCTPSSTTSSTTSEPQVARQNGPSSTTPTTALQGRQNVAPTSRSSETATRQPTADRQPDNQPDDRQDPSVIGASFPEREADGTAAATGDEPWSRPNATTGGTTVGEYRTVSITGGETFPLPVPSPVFICPDCGLTRKRARERPGWETHPACRPVDQCA